MPEARSIQGALQAQIMSALWRLERGTVEQVRRAMPPRYRGAYTTVQTVLNRLADRDLLSRRREGNAIVYRPRMTEDQYLTETIDATLAGASPTARQAALAQLIGEMEEDELSTLRDLAREIGRKRRSKRR